jgi:DNA polymerase-3 subunit delta
MALIDAQKFYRDLEKGDLAPMYFLLGEEPYLLNQSVERFKFAVLTEGAIDFN